MVAAHHLINSLYACWLPNDPRGSSSLEIRVPQLGSLGELHLGRKKIQPAGHVLRDFYKKANELLKYPRLYLNDEERLLVAESFRKTIEAHHYTCYACAIMWDHVHLLIRKHKHLAEDMIGNFQTDSRQFLNEKGKRTEDHPVWGGPGWKVFLETEEEIRRTIKYIEDNPLKAGWPAQAGDFVKIYDGWLPGGRMKK